MQTKSDAGMLPWTEPDGAPQLTGEFFGQAELHAGSRLVRRGRGQPRSEQPKRQVTSRLDRGVIDRYRAAEPGWQVRMNEALRAGLDRPSPDRLQASSATHHPASRG